MLRHLVVDSYQTTAIKKSLSNLLLKPKWLQKDFFFPSCCIFPLPTCALFPKESFLQDSHAVFPLLGRHENHRIHKYALTCTSIFENKNVNWGRYALNFSLFKLPYKNLTFLYFLHFYCSSMSTKQLKPLLVWKEEFKLETQNVQNQWKLIDIAAFQPLS